MAVTGMDQGLKFGCGLGPHKLTDPECLDRDKKTGSTVGPDESLVRKGPFENVKWTRIKFSSATVPA